MVEIVASKRPLKKRKTAFIKRPGPPAHKRFQHRTVESKRKAVKDVIEHVKKGITIGDAIKLVHLSWTSWAMWSRLYAPDFKVTPGQRYRDPGPLSRHDADAGTPPASIAKQPTYAELATENKYLREELGKRLLAEFIAKAPKS